MGKIHVLSDVLASQVAAGEVVERPASVVKELVENSLDAGASWIEIRVDRGGVALLRVSDDGCGMNREDAVLSLERHATSKLRTAADLAAIRTLGFRGEALPSIASVARFTLATREAEALAGTEVMVEGGKILGVRDWGGAPGTVIEVRNLFFNVPARRKFLRSENTEFGHIEQTLRVQALAHPRAGFTLVRDGRLSFQLPGRGSLRTRIEGLIGAELAAGLIERPEIERGGLRVHGWLGAPGRSRADRSLTLVFINGRAVESPVLYYALRTGYGDSLSRGQHPLCFLFVEMDPAAVDVNVHPAKKEVRFRDGLGVQAVLAAVVQEALRENATTPGRAADRAHSAPTAAVALQSATTSPPSIQTPGGPALPVERGSTAPASAPIFHSAAGAAPDGSARVQPRPTTAPRPTAEPRPTAAPVLRPATEAAQSRLDLPVRSGGSDSPTPPGVENRIPKFHLRGMLAQIYAVLESDEGLVLMELRAAHERVLYEDLRRQLSSGAVAAQPLLVPLSVPLSPRDFALVHDHLDALRRLGFGVEEFGANTLKLDSLPAALGAADPSSFLVSLLDDLSHAGEAAARHRLDLDHLTAAVCTRAVPRQQNLSTSEVEALLTRLLACDMPYCDPAGRPTLVQLSYPELERKFGRRG